MKKLIADSKSFSRFTKNKALKSRLKNYHLKFLTHSTYICKCQGFYRYHQFEPVIGIANLLVPRSIGKVGLAHSQNEF